MGARALPEWHTPNAKLKMIDWMNAKLEENKLPLEKVPEEEITFFNNSRTQGVINQYDQFFSYTKVKPHFDERKVRDNRNYMPCIWENIWEQDKDRPIPLTSAHVYGRPCRLNYDFLEKNHNRSSAISGFYRRRGVISPEEKEPQ